MHNLVVDVWLEALVKVVRAQTGRDNGADEQQNGEDGKGSQRLASRLVVLLAGGVGDIHSNELEEEVAHGNEVDDDDADHAGK